MRYISYDERYGYPIGSGYIGQITEDCKTMEFETEGAYNEYVEEYEND